MAQSNWREALRYNWNKHQGDFLVTLGSVVASMVVFAAAVINSGGDAFVADSAVPRMTLVFVAGLVAALGIGRLTSPAYLQDESARQLTEIHGHLLLNQQIAAKAQGKAAMYLPNKDVVYDTAVNLLRNAKESVQVTAFGHGKWQGNPEYLQEAALAAKRVRESPNGRRDFYHKVIFSWRREEPDEERKAHIRDRISAFSKAGASAALLVRVIELDLKMDFLIVDTRHVIIAIQTTDKQNDSSNEGPEILAGVCFVDEPSFARQLSSWYEERLWDRSGVLDEKDLRA